MQITFYYSTFVPWKQESATWYKNILINISVYIDLSLEKILHIKYGKV